MDNSWSHIKKFLFLFMAAYMVLYANSLQFLLTKYFQRIWGWAVPKFASIIGISEPVVFKETGSGDTLYYWCLVGFLITLSFFVAGVITLVDRKRTNYLTLMKWLFIILRYYIAAQMINYGLSKIFYIQFSAPSMIQLDQKMGDMSPMGILWNFMGASKPYTIFAGILELIGGLLLLSRKTQTLGALVCFGVMLNVMLLNFCYDVPVKLLSTHIVLMSLILIYYDRRRLYDFFIGSRAVDAWKLGDVVPLKWAKWKSILKWILLIGYLGYSLFEVKKLNDEYGPGAEAKAIEGSYKVSTFKLYQDGTEVAEVADSMQWEEIFSGSYGWGRIKLKDGEKFWRKIRLDTIYKTILLTSRTDTVEHRLNYLIENDSLLFLNGYYKSDSIAVSLIKRYEDEYLLINRGFHWVQEYPYNR